MISFFKKIFGPSAADEIRMRQAEILMESIRQPISQRMCMAAGLVQLPWKCDCGFHGTSSTEMEKHFNECRTYANGIYDRIQQKKEQRKLYGGK